MLGRAGSWVGALSAGAISNGRWWFYQDFAAASGPGITLSGNSNGSGGAAWSSANVVNSSAVVTDTDGNPVYTSATSTDTNRVTVTAHTSASVTLSAAPNVSYGTVRIWYLYTQSTGSLPLNMEIAPDFVKQQRAQWIDANYLNQNDNLSDLPNAATARTNLGFTAQTTGQIYYGAGGTLPASDAFFFWDSSNKFHGIGTSVPASRLHLNDAGANAVSSQFTNSVTGLTSGDGSIVGIDASGNMVIKNQESLPIIFSAGGAEVGRFLSAGNLLVKNGLNVEDPGAGTNAVSITASSGLSASYSLTLPTGLPGTTQFLTSTSAGVLAFSTFTGGSPLTTKGDILGYDTGANRIPVGTTFGQVLSVDATNALGVAWGPALRADASAIASGVKQKAVLFTNAMPSTNYAISALLANYTDGSLAYQPVAIIAKTTAGFTAEWSSFTENANYVLEWMVIGKQL